MAFVPGRILLTGASGFVGRHLTACLAAAYPDADWDAVCGGMFLEV